MKRTSGAAYLAERDRAAGGDAAGEAKKHRHGGFAAHGGFAQLLRESGPKEDDFEPVTKAKLSTGRLTTVLVADGADRFAQPRPAWWLLQRDTAPVGPVNSASLDLTKLDAEASVVALLAEEPGAGSEVVREADTDRRKASAKEAAIWSATVVEGAAAAAAGEAPAAASASSSSSKEVIRLRRPEGVKAGGVWFVAVFVRSGEGETSAWRSEAVNEIYPVKRVMALLPLRCKDFIPVHEAKPTEESPGDRAKRLLEEAMKTA